LLFRRTLLSLAVLLASCSDGSADLTVDVVTDYVPGVDFAIVETEVSAEDPSAGATGTVQRAQTMVTGSEDFLRGARVAEISDVGLGRRYVRVTLRDAAEARVAVRTLSLNLSGSFAATLLFTSDCEGVECTAPQECQAGECVDPQCSPSTPEFCSDPPGCTIDDDCVAMIGGSCTGTPVCGGGTCFCEVVPERETACDNGVDDDEDGDVDCEDSDCVGGPCAAPGTEANCVDMIDDDGDGQTDCEDSDCNGAACDDGDACTHSDVCGGGSCGGSRITCNDTECATRSCNGTAACTESPRTGAACADDGIPCTIDECGSSGICEHTYAGDNTSCHPTLSHFRCCSGSCVDTHTSRIHCGGCELTCGFGGLNQCHYDATLDAAWCECPDGSSGWCVGNESGAAACAFTLCYCTRDAGCPGSARCVDDDPGGGLAYCRYP